MRPSHSPKICPWCDAPLTASTRTYCSDECRMEAHEDKQWNPTPDEIRAICRQIQQEGGEAWKRNRACHRSQPVTVTTVRVTAFNGDSSW